jgi:zinc-binding alcohol dehydrogenase/oxidoreductase
LLKAIVHEGKPGISGLSLRDMKEPQPGAGEVRVKLKTAGMNHRDLFVLHRHKPEDPPLIVGSDGAGIVDAVGDGVANVAVGDEVIINPGLGWNKNSDAPPPGFEIVGLPFHGTFAEYIVVPAENAVPKPGFLIWEEAGVLSLAALTAYRALFTRGKVTADTKLLLPGVGSGVITFVLQFAKAIGATVYVTSRSEEKRRQAIALGADKAFDSNDDWSEALEGEKVDLVIESVGAATFNKSIAQLRPGGTIVTFGASAGDEVKLNLRNFFYGQFNMLGTTMGSAEELHDMLQFIEKHRIKPVIDQIFPLSKYEEAFRRLDDAEQFGKIGFLID